jgi:hypothetical protein
VTKEFAQEVQLRKIAKNTANMVLAWWRQLHLLACERDAAIVEVLFIFLL